MNEYLWIDGYLRTHYLGCIEGNYDQGCHLYFKDINNFIQNVGRFSNIEIIRLEDGDTLLNTCGTYIDRIWPRMSWGDRGSTEMMNSINYIASKIGELREKEGLYPEPLPKIKRFIKETLGQEAIERNEEILKSVREEEQVESAAMKMQSLNKGGIRMFLTRDEVNKIKEQYPAGTRIKLTYMDDKHSVPEGTLGTVTAVDDQGQLDMKWENGSSLALITNVDEFTVLQESLQTPDLKVVIVEPGKHPRMEIIKDTLEEKQRIVDGYIEELDLDDGAVLVCNEVGKLIDLKANRKVGSDIIAGTFFIVGDDGSEKFVSLTDEQVDQYMKQFYEIEEHSQTEMLVDDYAILSSLGWKSMG